MATTFFFFAYLRPKIMYIMCSLLLCCMVMVNPQYGWIEHNRWLSKLAGKVLLWQKQTFHRWNWIFISERILKPFLSKFYLKITFDTLIPYYRIQALIQRIMDVRPTMTSWPVCLPNITLILRTLYRSLSLEFRSVFRHEILTESI